MDWKSAIVCQLKTHKDQWNIFNEIIGNYNRLLENNISLQTQCSKLGKDVNHLRLANAGLEKASEASQELANTNNKLTVANEEVIMHLREKGELAREVLRLNHALTEANEKLLNDENTLAKYQDENNLLTNKIEKLEYEVKDLIEINQVLREEFVAVQIQFEQLQIEHKRMKPSAELEHELETQKRLNKQLEEQLIESKRIQLEMLDAEVKRYDRQVEFRKRSSTNEDDRSSTTSSRQSLDLIAAGANGTPIAQNNSTDETLAGRRNTTGGNIFSNFKKIFNPGLMVNPMNDNLSRTPTFCLSSSVPTREINHWDCTELEVYALQFQPSGSLLATGCSDKMVHLWEISTSGQPRRYCSLQGSPGAVNAIDFDSEGARLLAGCSGDKVFIWSYGSNYTPKDTYNGHSKSVFTCKFISSTKLATASADRLIKVWDLHNRQCIRSLPAGSKCHDLVITDAVGTIVSGHFDKKIRIWDTYVDKCRDELELTAVITSLSYNAEKKQILACLKDNTLKLIDLRKNAVIHSFTHDRFQVCTDTQKAVLSPDGRYACAGSQDGSVIVWNTSNGVCESFFSRRHTTMVTSVAWHPEGRYVASCEKHRQVVLWSD